jgi:hypothetical protein
MTPRERERAIEHLLELYGPFIPSPEPAPAAEAPVSPAVVAPAADELLPIANVSEALKALKGIKSSMLDKGSAFNKAGSAYRAREDAMKALIAAGVNPNDKGVMDTLGRGLNSRDKELLLANAQRFYAKHNAGTAMGTTELPTGYNEAVARQREANRVPVPTPVAAVATGYRDWDGTLIPPDPSPAAEATAPPAVTPVTTTSGALDMLAGIESSMANKGSAFNKAGSAYRTREKAMRQLVDAGMSPADALKHLKTGLNTRDRQMLELYGQDYEVDAVGARRRLPPQKPTPTPAPTRGRAVVTDYPGWDDNFNTSAFQPVNWNDLGKATTSISLFPR